jgi:hypothetical protein
MPDVTPEVKLIEIRDKGTFVPAMAIRVSSVNGYLMRRAGFGATPLVYLVHLTGQHAKYDAFAWTRPFDRTMRVAHLHLEEKWSEIADGDVVDVEFLLKEKPTPKTSERVTHPHTDPF